MQYKKYIKQRNGSIQGLRSFNDTLPKNVKKLITKKGYIYSEILNNWKFFVGEKLFKVCYPKSFKNSNKFSESTLSIMVQRGHEVELEYSKKEIMDKMNSFFKNINVFIEKIKLISFNNENNINDRKNFEKTPATNYKFRKKLTDVKNEKIRKSLLELSKVFKEK